MENRIIYTYSTYLKEKYSGPAYRVAVDAGFSCPNRSGGRMSPGCIYCDEYGSAAAYNRKEGLGDIPDRFVEKEEKLKPVPPADLQDQIANAVSFLKKRYKARYFMLYFQSFSSTNDTVASLRQIYDRALSAEHFEELIVSTRPDCLNEDICALLASYKKDYQVWLELGLQSIQDRTLKRINRGHDFASFEKAFLLSRKAGLKISVHIILGLPGEEWTDMEKTVRYLAGIKPEAVKIHNLHIPVGTALYQEYLSGEIPVAGPQRYMEYLIKSLELLPPDTIIQRITCDTAKIRRAAPRQFWKKTFFYDKILAEMKRRSTYQGRIYLHK